MVHNNVASFTYKYWQCFAEWLNGTARASRWLDRLIDGRRTLIKCRREEVVQEVAALLREVHALAGSGWHRLVRQGQASLLVMAEFREEYQHHETAGLPASLAAQRAMPPERGHRGGSVRHAVEREGRVVCRHRAIASWRFALAQVALVGHGHEGHLDLARELSHRRPSRRATEKPARLVCLTESE